MVQELTGQGFLGFSFARLSAAGLDLLEGLSAMSQLLLNRFHCGRLVSRAQLNHRQSGWHAPVCNSSGPKLSSYLLDTTLGRIVHGSAAEMILHNTPCPVLVV